MAVPATALQETRDFLVTSAETVKVGLSQEELDSLSSSDADNHGMGTEKTESPIDDHLLMMKRQRSGGSCKDIPASPQKKALPRLTVDDIASPQKGLTQEQLDAMAIGFASPTHRALKGETKPPSSPQDDAILARKRAHAARRLGRPCPLSPPKELGFATTPPIAEETKLSLPISNPAGISQDELDEMCVTVGMDDSREQLQIGQKLGSKNLKNRERSNSPKGGA